jgi:hypothetical protein
LDAVVGNRGLGEALPSVHRLKGHLKNVAGAFERFKRMFEGLEEVGSGMKSFSCTCRTRGRATAASRLSNSLLYHLF